MPFLISHDTLYKISPSLSNRFTVNHNHKQGDLNSNTCLDNRLCLALACTSQEHSLSHL